MFSLVFDLKSFENEKKKHEKNEAPEENWTLDP